MAASALQPTPKVVVGIDGSSSSRHALRWAAREAARRGAVLDLVHTWHVPAAAEAAGADVHVHAHKDGLQTDARQLVAAAAEEIRLLGLVDLPVEGRIVEGHPVALLVAESRTADLLVVGASGRGEVLGVLLGSVTTGCAHHSEVPFAVIGPEAPDLDGGEIVVGVDRSEGSRHALRWAIAAAQAADASVRIVHVWHTEPDTALASIAITGPLPPPREHPAPIDSIVADWLADIDALPPTTLQVVAPPAAKALLREAEGASALVVGSRGHGGFLGLVLGSVSGHCLHHSPCPLVVVPRPSER